MRPAPAFKPDCQTAGHCGRAYAKSSGYEDARPGPRVSTLGSRKTYDLDLVESTSIALGRLHGELPLLLAFPPSAGTYDSALSAS